MAQLLNKLSHIQDKKLYVRQYFFEHLTLSEALNCFNMK